MQVIIQMFKDYCFKSAVGFFSFFSSTNVETKNVCPIAYNSLIVENTPNDNRNKINNF